MIHNAFSSGVTAAEAESTPLMNNNGKRTIDYTAYENYTNCEPYTNFTSKVKVERLK